MKKELILEYTTVLKHDKIVDRSEKYDFNIKIEEVDNIPKVWITFPNNFNGDEVQVYIRDLNTNLGVHRAKCHVSKGGSFWLAPYMSISQLSGIKVEVTDGGKIIDSKSVRYSLDNRIIIRGKEVKVYSNRDDASYFPFREVIIDHDYNKFGCFVKEGDVCLDLGGNLGFFSLYALSKGAAKSYVVEPVADTYYYLSMNVSCCDDIIPINCGVGGKTRKRSIEVFSNSSGGNTITDFKQKGHEDMESCVQEIDVININELIQQYNIDHINFLKFDIEASEYEVFEAFDEDYLTNHVDRMIGEYHHNFNGEINTIINKLKKCGFKYRKTIWGENFGYIVAWKPGEVDEEKLEELNINCNFVEIPFVEISGNPELGEFDVEFIDSKTGDIVHSGNINVGCWISASRRWFTKWKISVKKEGKEIYANILNSQNKKYLITLDSKSLGDSLAWMPYAEEFRKKNNCQVVLSTFWNDLFKKEYPEIEFVSPGSVINNIYGRHNIGWYFPYDFNRNPNDFRAIPLQQTASDILGLDFKEIKPKITIPDKPRTIEEKYVCIGIHSTAQAKYWNYPEGWQKITDYLNERGYKVVHISKEQGAYMGNTPPKNIIDKTGDYFIEDRIVDLKYADMYVGIGSGLSWLSWAVGTPTILISGFSAPWCESKEGIIRLHNDGICNSCFNDSNITFDPGDWNWCPRDKDFECSKAITSKMVINEIDKIIDSKEYDKS